jgi:hypothetical protein
MNYKFVIGGILIGIAAVILISVWSTIYKSYITDQINTQQLPCPQIPKLANKANFQKITPDSKLELNVGPKLEQTNNWDRYTPEGLEIMFPNNWSGNWSTESQQRDGVYLFFAKRSSQEEGIHAAFQIGLPVTIDSDVSTWIKSCNAFQDQSLNKTSQETINGTMFEKVFNCLENRCETYYYTKRNGKLYSLNLTLGKYDVDKDKQDLVNILHTLKFTN